MKTMNEAVKVPTLLSFDGGNVKPGRGEAGWTVYEFATRAEALAFMAAHSFAAMPCWSRI